MSTSDSQTKKCSRERGIAKRQTRRSANTKINIRIMMRSRDNNLKSKSHQRRLSLPKQIDHCCIPWTVKANPTINPS
jgi:hypothetical protein